MRRWIIALAVVCVLLAPCAKESEKPKESGDAPAPAGPSAAEREAFETQKDVLRAQVEAAIVACQLILDSEHAPEIRGDAKTSLKNVLTELEKLDASMTRPKINR